MRSLVLLLFIMLTACQTVRIQFNDKWDRDQKPSYTDYFDYYWWGLKGTNSVSVQKACVDQKPYGLVQARTVEDMIITALTLGIYAPLTVKVWCGDQ